MPAEPRQLKVRRVRCDSPASLSCNTRRQRKSEATVQSRQTHKARGSVSMIPMILSALHLME
eukprot:3874924-Amphidinium_carterae.1